MMRARHLAGLAMAGVLAVGCAPDDAGVPDGRDGDDRGGKLQISGNCGLGENPIAVEKVLPTSVLETLIDDGEYKAVGGLKVRDGKLPAAYDGDCALQQAGTGQDSLELGLVNSSDPRYADAKAFYGTADFEGFVRVNDTTYAFADGDDKARAVAILPDRLVILRVRRPAEGVDVVKAAGAAVTVVAERIAALTPSS